MTLESHGGHRYSRGDTGVDARELTRMFACNQASRIDCQFVEDIIYGVFAARSTGLRYLVDRRTSNSGWQRQIRPLGSLCCAFMPFSCARTL